MDAITLTDAQKQMLIHTYEVQLEEIDKKRKEIIDLLTKLKNSTPKKPSLTSDKQFTWKGISLQILAKKDDFLTTNDIYNEILEMFPEFRTESRRTLIGSLSGSLSQLATDKRLVRVQNNFGSGNYWGLFDWTENGNIREEYSIKLKRKHLDPYKLL